VYTPICVHMAIRFTSDRVSQPESKAVETAVDTVSAAKPASAVRMDRARRKVALVEAARASDEATALRAARASRVSIHLRVEPEVYEAWRASGAGWQTRINALLREHKP
jgi:uncharacterized protein (DUF4415 family)